MSHQTLRTCFFQVLPAEFPQSVAKKISINSERRAGRFEAEWPSGAAISDPCLCFGERKTLYSRAAHGLKAQHSVD
jgi:hypothetical protein